MQELILYHGSQNIIKKPLFGYGKTYNDYGLGFYCTESLELAKEWACLTESNGYANKYSLNCAGLDIFNLFSEKMHILNWLALLIKNRTFRIDSGLALEAKEYILNEFLPNIDSADVVTGYRADDSYFSFANSFLNGALSLEQLSKAMKFGNLGEQIVLKSQKAFLQIEFIETELADAKEYFQKREQRDTHARQKLKKEQNKTKVLSDIYILDILREQWKNNDARLR